MGGPGSGSHYYRALRDKKTVVEDCLSLDANRWAREGILSKVARAPGISRVSLYNNKMKRHGLMTARAR